MRAIIIGIAVTVMNMTFSNVGLTFELTPIMPEDLTAYAAKNGCEQVSDFFKRPGMVNPPYVYDYHPDPADDSAALWCQVGHGDNRKFFLLIMTTKKDHEWAKCPTKIEWQHYPGGLSTYNDTRTTLDDFVYLANPTKRGPRNIKLNGNGILSEYDGVEELFYCYKGEWLIRQRH